MAAIIYSDLSDHYSIVVNVNMQIKFLVPKAELATRVFLERKIARFVRELENVDWDKFVFDHTEKNNPRLSYTSFFKIYDSLYKKKSQLK